jgi:twitching motility protein PilT
MPPGPILETGYGATGTYTLPGFVRDIAAAAPALLVGEDRLRFYMEQVDGLGADQREAMRQCFERMVAYTHDVGASDMAVGGRACGGRVWYRVDGDKKPHHEHGGTLDEVDVVIVNLLSERQRADLFAHRSSDFSYFLEAPSGQRRFRTTCYFDQGHLGMALRAIPERVRTVESLGFASIINRGMMFRHVRDGLTLITGVTGSGKSTTLDAFIEANNRDFDGHIVIIAKPIEFVHTPNRCIIRHREVGPDVPSFKDGVVQALRQDPDIIMIGEMRDPETIDAAIEASDTGHKVFSTLHTSSTVESLDRMIAEYPSDEQNRVRVRLADVLRCVISQKLPPKIGGGRILAKEVLWITPSVKAAILNNNTGEIYQMIWEGAAQGMITMEQDLIRLYRERKITVETAVQYSNNKRRVQQLLGGGNAAAA